MRELADLRRELEDVDDALVDVLARRAALVGEAWALKAARGLPRKDQAREDAEIARLVARAEAAGLDGDAVRAVLAAVIGADLRAR